MGLTLPDSTVPTLTRATHSRADSQRSAAFSSPANCGGGETELVMPAARVGSERALMEPAHLATLTILGSYCLRSCSSVFIVFPVSIMSYNHKNKDARSQEEPDFLFHGTKVVLKNADVPPRSRHSVWKQEKGISIDRKLATSHRNGNDKKLI